MAEKIKGSNILMALCRAMSEEDERDYQVQRKSCWLLSWQKKILWEIGTKLLAKDKNQIFLFHKSEDVGGTGIRNRSLLTVL